MIFTFIAAIVLLGIWKLNDQEWGAWWMKYAGVFIALCFLFLDAYNYVILPDEISKFYNNGAGITYGNSTIFNSSDKKIAYFFITSTGDYVYMEMLRNFAYIAAIVFVVALAIYYVSKVTKGGEFKKEM